MEGIFGLVSGEDLLKKLEWEYDHLSNDLASSYHAYNYFVTAWHLLEWYFPDPDGKEIRINIKERYIILEICEHIAVGAKHFRPTKASLKSVQSAEIKNVWAEGVWAPGVWKDGVWAKWLDVYLQGTAAEKYGDVINVKYLADEVIKFWRNFNSNEYN